MSAIIRYLESRGYSCIPVAFYKEIRLWGMWYRGRVPSFHDYRQYNGRKKVCRRRKSLSMAKTVAEDWANLLMNEKVEITAGTEEVTGHVRRTLAENHFISQANKLTESVFAMGTGAFVERMEEDSVRIDYLRAGMIYPLTWENERVTECAFASERKQGRTVIVYLNIHRLEDGAYVIENHMFRREGATLAEIPLEEDVAAEVRTGSAVPRFQILRPNLANNFDPDSPMGISVFANAIDQLEAVDLVYDSYCNEFRLGKKRILVPLSFAQIQMEEDGTSTPVFDDNDTEFYTIPELDGNTGGIREMNMTLRHEAHEAALRTQLDLLSEKAGMGKDRYTFRAEAGLKTATEVISQRSELYQSLRKHELELGDALKGLVLALCDMMDLEPGEIAVRFDDSIIEDSAAQRENDRQDVRDGLLAPWEYRTKWMGEDEDTARARAAEAGGEPVLGFA